MAALSPPPQFVFAYGSLCALAQAGDAPAVLHGHRRVWGVAMDNRATLPGYKHYLRASDRSRPAVHVAFLDVTAAAPDTVAGICRPVTAAELATLDARERNYDRVDVTERIECAGPPGQVWAYVGSSAGRARLTVAREAATAVVSSEYWDLVRTALTRVGGTELERFRADWDLAELPIAELLRRDAAQS